LSVLLSILAISFSDDKFIVEPYSIFLVLTIASFSLALYNREFSIKWKNYNSFFYFVGCTVLLLLLGQSIGGSPGVLPTALSKIGIIIGNATLAFIMYFYTTEDTFFYKKVIAMIALGISASIVAYILAPFVGWAPFLDSSYVRFGGFFHDPNYYATYLILPLLISFGIPFTSHSKMVRLLTALLSSFGIATFLWSGSRGGMLGLVAAGICFGIVTIRYKIIPAKKFFGLLIAISVCSLVFLPSVAQDHILNRTRFLTQSTNSLIDGQERFLLWKQGIHAVLENPFGYGPSYDLTGMIKSSFGDSARVHNTFLEILLSGGILLFILVVIGLYEIYKAISIQNQSVINIALYAGFFGMFIAIMFNDAFSSHFLWVAGAAIFSARNNVQ
jgi:hypothetical protein